MRVHVQTMFVGVMWSIQVSLDCSQVRLPLSVLGPLPRFARLTKPVTAYRFSACMLSQAMRAGDMYSVTRVSFLD